MGGADLEEIAELARGHGIALDELAAMLRQLPEPSHGQLSSAEQDVLAGLGVGSAEDGAAAGPVLAGLLRRRKLEQGSLTVEQVAHLLRRDPSRIRQRLAGPHRSLLGFHRRSGQREWLLPRFQFDLGVYDLDGWAALLQALPPADQTSPAALVAWLTEPCAHLGGRSRTKALSGGYAADALVAEAAAFGMPA